MPQLEGINGVARITTSGAVEQEIHVVISQEKIDALNEKIVKAIKKIIPDAPHATLLTIDATTGQNALNQVKTFKEMVDVSGLIVTKLDGTAKGGIIVAVAEETGIPIHYIGIGEGIDDLDEFNARDFARNLLEIK